MPHIAIWKFVVRAEKTADFVRAYGPDGTWVQLFRQGEGFLSTHLLEEAHAPNTFITIDTWSSKDAYQAFRTRFADAYAALDLRCAGLTVREEKLAEGDTRDSGT